MRKCKKVMFFGLAVCVLTFLSACRNKNNEAASDYAVDKKRSEAAAYYQTGENQKANQILEEIVRTVPLEQKTDARVGIYYDMTCNYALLGDSKKALVSLKKVIESGYANSNHIKNDSDLKCIRENEEFIKIVNDLESKGRLWKNPFIETPFKENISEDEKIAGLSRLWSEIKFNFVNFDFIPGLNADSLYMAYLPKVRRSENTYAYYRLLQRFCVHFKDGHTEIKFPKELRARVRGRVPIQTRLVEDMVIVTKVYSEKLKENGIIPGLEIIEVDDYDVKVYADEFVRPYWVSNTIHGTNRTIFEYAFLFGPVGKDVRLKFKDENGKTFSRSLPRLSRLSVPWEPVTYRLLENNIGYVNLKSFYAQQIVAEFDSLFSKMQTTDAIIIDLRDNGGGNGSVGWAILGYLTDKPFEIFKWITRLYRPIWRAWGRGEEVYKAPPAYRFADKSKYYSKPVVLLTRPRTGSMAENFCMGFQIMKRGKIIGGPTAGSSGTPLSFALPGGGSAQVVTTRGMYPDGKELIGFGVQPDIKVSPMVEDFRTGRDRILERAIEYLEGVK